MIAVQHMLIWFQAKLIQGLGQCNFLCLLKIQNGIVQVQKQKLKHDLFSLQSR